MKLWEYIAHKSDVHDLEKDLDKVGSEGWELVQILMFHDHVLLVCKRRYDDRPGF